MSDRSGRMEVRSVRPGGKRLPFGLWRLVLKDDSAQALTEFVIVIPVVILLFILMVQYFLTVQASQIGQYAAFVAARVYAVRGSWDPRAVIRAEKAAALAYAPVSKPAPGEALDIAAVAGNLAGEFRGVLPGELDSLASLAEGYAIARYVRMSPKVGGGSIIITNSGAPEEVSVTLNYAYPVAIPGLNQLWSLCGKGGDIKSDLKDLGQGLKGFYALKVASPYPYVNVKSRCVMGYEDWSGLPRERRTVDSSSVNDTELEERQQKLENARKNYLDEVKDEQKACEMLQKERAREDAARRKYEASRSNDDRDSWESAKSKADNARQIYERERRQRQAAQEDYEKLGEMKMGDVPPCDS